MKLSIIIPVFNEINCLEKFTKNLTSSFKNENVEYIFVNDEMREFKVHADFGTFMNKTNDLDLEGNVKMLIETDIIKGQLANDSISKRNPKPAN